MIRGTYRLLKYIWISPPTIISQMTPPNGVIKKSK